MVWQVLNGDVFASLQSQARAFKVTTRQLESLQQIFFGDVARADANFAGLRPPVVFFALRPTGGDDLEKAEELAAGAGPGFDENLFGRDLGNHRLSNVQTFLG